MLASLGLFRPGKDSADVVGVLWVDGDLGRVVHQQVDVIVLTVELNQFRLEVGTDAGEYPVQVIEDFLVNTSRQYLVTKTKCTCIREYVVLSVPNIVVVAS